ncbi:PfkB family carbohydrate kinase [[Clostridium] symbiosum]|uniref:PfkB family carbohydrate kinase n=1 Tax=Clostridium symbiosum TaxID=1512 RepID=UPI001D0701E0|nr:PfkB family carbohydrate kinase [[Clostridium] symbiosum]MCB6609245.1 PfkB family carbohydrate kinase [[Clostridium] symbiosum]MCB6932791.1 PfkB family carbohydrate kinase [[Clostridium] symbiosum]
MALKDRTDILVIGNLNLDLIFEQQNIHQDARKKIGESFCLAPGGNANNQTVAASRCGVPARLAGMTGDDSFGQQLRESLEKEGISTELLRTVEGVSTGVSLIITSSNRENQYWDVLGANAQMDTDCIEQLRPYISEARILLIGLGIPEKSMIRAIEIANEAETTVMFVAYQSKTFSSDILGRIDVMFLDSSEAGKLSGCEVTNLKSARVAASMLLKGGVKQAVLIHMKSKFLLLAGNDGFSLFDAPKEPMVDASTMDDTFSGVFAACIVRGMELEKAAEISYAAANLCGSRFGAQTSIPTKEEMQKIFGG